MIALTLAAAVLGTVLPEKMDFADRPYHDGYYDVPSEWTKQFADIAYERGLAAFNSAPEMVPFFYWLKDAYAIDAVVETGTCQGCSTVFFAQCFDQVHTIEISRDSCSKASHKLQKYSNVQCHLGSSEKVLKEILPSLEGKRILFYLDAHWDSYWPLLDELNEISKTHKDNCVIVIDDVQVPGRLDIDWDGYGGNICCYDYFKPGLEQVFSEYSSHYLIPKHRSSHGKYVAIPKNWKGE